MGFMEDTKSCWISFWHYCCPCCCKPEEKKLGYTRVWDDYFAPKPGEAQWEQLPDSIKDTVKRTSEQLHKYADHRKSAVAAANANEDRVPLSDYK